MAEILALRSYTRRVEDLGGGVRRTEFHVGHIHYKDGAGAFVAIDHTWVDQGTHWEMTGASYRMRVAKDFSAPQLIRYQNRYEGAAHDIYYEPHSLVWATGRDLASVQTFRAQQAVTGILSGHTIRFTDAFGPGLHFEVTLRGSGFTKELVIRRRADLENPPTANHRLVLLSRYSQAGPSVSVRDTQGRVWAGTGEFDDAADDGFALQEAGGARSLIRPAYIVDSAPEPQAMRCPVIWTARNSALWQAKVLPTAALNNGTYPLRADTVTSFFAGAGDGHCETNSQATWALAHAHTGSFADSTSTTMRCNSGLFTNYSIRRVLVPIDISGVGSDHITAATVYLKVQALTDNSDNDGDHHYTIVGPTTQASNTELVTGDFDKSSTQELSSRVDYSSLAAVGSYQSWALNATGLTVINKTGPTLLGLREGHDLINSAYAGANNTSNQVRFYTSEQAGTGDDPYLEITHVRRWILRTP
jgi:hypothetical protein